MAKKINPCPFCGKVPEVFWMKGYWRVRCADELCFTNIRASRNRDYLMEQWNTRIKAKKEESDGRTENETLPGV